MIEYADKLLDWYDECRRDLPWRAAPGTGADPYRVWLSEVMLQQTTVATVKDYYKKFLMKWPTVTCLAEAPLEEVLDAWAGLGYYARARNLHKCAVVVAAEYNGAFPRTAKALKSLPGIGDYTSAAIAAIAYDQSVAVVDGNVERVVSRLFQIDEPLPRGRKTITARTGTITPEARAGDFAQAMMDLGATICTPRSPACGACPLRSNCAARQAGDMEKFPVKPPKKVKPVRRCLAYLPHYKGQFLLERRPQRGLLGGMPGLYSTPWIEQEDYPTDAQSSAPVKCDWALQNGIAKHTFTHFHLEARVLTGDAERLVNLENGFWVTGQDLAELGLPTVFRKMLNLV